MTKMVRLEISHGVRFDLRQWRLLQKVAAAEKVRVGVIVRRAVEEYLKGK